MNPASKRALLELAEAFQKSAEGGIIHLISAVRQSKISPEFWRILYLTALGLEPNEIMHLSKGSKDQAN